MGNVVDPHDMLDRFPCDTLRWYLCREATFGDDVRFSDMALRLMHNAELCDNLGNLVNRAVSLCGGCVPKCTTEVALPFNLKELKKEVQEAFEAYRLSEAANLTIVAAGATNKWITNLEPWKMKDPEKQELRAACLRKLLEVPGDLKIDASRGRLRLGALLRALHPYGGGCDLHEARPPVQAGASSGGGCVG